MFSANGLILWRIFFAAVLRKERNNRVFIGKSNIYPRFVQQSLPSIHNGRECSTLSLTLQGRSFSRLRKCSQKHRYTRLPLWKPIMGQIEF
ncbi:hypothetical protein AMTRI_Chr01g111470 [Amborella trichopoda]